MLEDNLLQMCELMEENFPVSKEDLIQACKHLPEGKLLDTIIEKYVQNHNASEMRKAIQQSREDEYLQAAVNSLQDRHSHYQECLEDVVSVVQEWTGVHFSYDENTSMKEVIEEAEVVATIFDFRNFLEEEYDQLRGSFDDIALSTTIRDLVAIIHKVNKP